MRVFCFISFIMLTFISSSYAQLCKNTLSKEELLYQNLNENIVSGIEFFNQNNNFGLQFEGSLDLMKWSEVHFSLDEFASIVGLTKDGSLYHLLRFDNERIIARKLSGSILITDFQITSNGKLLALGQNDKAYVFSSKLWSIPASKKARKRWKDLWVTLSIAAIGTKLTLAPDLFFYKDVFSYSIPLPLAEIGLTAVSAMTAGFSALFSFDYLNQNPSGLMRTNLNFKDSKWFLRKEAIELSESNSIYFSVPDLDSLPIKIPSNLNEDF